MKKSRFTESQIIAILREADAGMKVKEICCKHGISDATYYNWKAKYGGMGVSELKRMKDLEAPIRNMTPAEVRELLSGARVYIDFGTHPGSDRLPREAAISGCCVVTGRQGSAGNPLDVPVPDKYKFDEKDESVFSKVDSVLADILSNYQDRVADFEEYRRQIVMQEKSFEDEISTIFSGLRK